MFLSAPSAVTLMIKCGGRRGDLVSATFASPAEFESFAATHTIYLVSKDDKKKKLVLSLTDAQSGVEGDYLLQTSPYGDLDEDVGNVERHRQNMSSEQKQATTQAIVASPVLRAKFGDLRLLADGCPITFVDNSDEPNVVVEADGIAVNSVVVILNEMRQAPGVADVSRLLGRAAVLERVLRNATYTTDPPDVLTAMEGITKVVPVLSGYYFDASVVAECEAAGVLYMKANGADYSAAV